MGSTDESKKTNLPPYSRIDDDFHKAGTSDGWHGVVAKGSKFEPEAGRYHLYIGLFCPFAHRVNLLRHLYGLQDVIPVSITLPYPRPWQFPSPDDPKPYSGSTIDHLYNVTEYRRIYELCDIRYTGKYSVPMLWDTQHHTIVNNESAEMLRWFPDAFRAFATKNQDLQLYPLKHRRLIDKYTPLIQEHINSGVYKAGFATTQEAYDAAIPPLFAALNTIEILVQMNGGPWVLGSDMTELDIRLFATLVRFDVIYVSHFKTNLGTIRGDYPVLENWLRHAYSHDAFRDSTDFTHIKEGYTKCHATINPSGIVPMGPYPEIATSFESDYSKMKPGGVYHPAVTDIQAVFVTESLGKL